MLLVCSGPKRSTICVTSQWTRALGHNGAAPLAAVDLRRSTNAQADARVAKQRRRCTRVDAGVEVDVGSVLIGA